MGWSGQFLHATVGYNAGGEDFSNHELSGSQGVDQIACQNQRNNTEWSNLIFELGNLLQEREEAQRSCRSMILQDFQVFPLPGVNPCPCTLFQAIFDPRFFFVRSTVSTICFSKLFPIGGGRQLCCYNQL